MQLNFAFRLSLYVTLAVAALCLGYAELPFLPEISVVSLLVFALLFIAFFFEGRWSLSIPAANVLGGVIAALLGAWFAYQFLRPSGSLLDSLPWPTSLLPYLGPVMMLVMTAKMFRPKHIGDFWAMQGIGLTLVALACALANDAIFAILFILYLISGVWSLTLFYLYRSTYRHPGFAITHLVKEPQLVPGEMSPYASDLVLNPSFRFTARLPWFGAAARWVFGISGASLILFLVTPRSPSNVWELSMGNKGRMEVGYSGETNIDLTRTGTLRVNHELAFEFRAEDHRGEAKTDLSEETRFRGRSMSIYANGSWRWERQTPTIQLIDSTIRPSRALPREGTRRLIEPQFNLTATLPDYGPTQYSLVFKPSPRLQGEVLADPVVWFPNRPAPIVTLVNGQSLAWIQNADGSFAPFETFIPGSQSYKQVLMPLGESDIGVPMRVRRSSLESLIERAPAGVRRFTDQLLDRFANDGKLPKEALRTDVFGFRPQEYHRRIARLLSDYLAESGEFTYSLKIRRGDTQLDPVEDFLVNVRSGHCNRYASALALMLRSQGIPAQMVLGFRGCHHVGEGKYQVFQHDAHAWVEALIEYREMPMGPFDDGTRWHWLSLDPTPSVGEPEAEGSAISDWFGSTQSRGDTLFKDFIVGYSAEKQQKTGKVLWTRLSETADSMWAEARSPRGIGTLAIVFGCIAVIVALSGRKRSRRLCSLASISIENRLPPVEFQRRLWTILARHDYEPRIGETAFEFVHSIAGKLPTEVATIPAEVVDVYYRVRFGERTLSPEESRLLTARLDTLEAGLRSRKEPS